MKIKIRTKWPLTVLFLAMLLLVGCTQNPNNATATASESSGTQNAIQSATTATPTPEPTQKATSTADLPTAMPIAIPPKLDGTALGRYLIQYADAPHWANWCKLTCEQVKYAIQDAACSLPGVGQYPNPLAQALDLTDADRNNETKVAQFQQRCQSISPDVLFDCDAFRNGTLSCGKGLAGCQDGGFLVQFNRTELTALSGYEADAQIFVDSHAFKKLLDKDDCPKAT